MSLAAFCRSLLQAARRTRTGRGRVWVIGPMPEPLNGQTNYNRRMVAELEKGADVAVLPTGGTGAQKIAAALILPILVLAFVRRGDRVYTSPPGQNGVWLFMGVLLVLRLKRQDHFLHHHSYRPINLGPTRPARTMVAVSGPYQRHVFLSERMRDHYADLYLTPALKARSLVLPNAYLFFERQAPGPAREGPVTLGHLSVITREKGIGHLMAMAERAFTAGVDMRLVMAGPVREDALKAEILDFCATHPGRADYLGPVFGEARDAFYRQLDLFALPSRLVDEADPLVILEAYAFGCEILASSTGCIPERMRRPEHLLTFDLDRDAAMLAEVVARIASDRDASASACRHHVETMHRDSVGQAEIFFQALQIESSSSGREAERPIPVA